MYVLAVEEVALKQRPEPKPVGGTVAARSVDVDGGEFDREGGRFRVRLFVPSWRRRTTRDVLAAGDAERERIAQDLHDGVQQHLTALRIRLGLAADRFGERGETKASAVLQGFGDDVDHVIDELRDLAHGIYPALLTSFGLAAALVSAGDAIRSAGDRASEWCAALPARGRNRRVFLVPCRA